MGDMKVHFMSENQTWGTPQAVFDYANERFGSFDIDLAASSENTKCEKFFDEGNSALEGEWGLWTKRGWLNPPYGRMLKPFALKVVDQLKKDNIKRVVMLVPARTDTVWWNALVENASHVIFFKGRLRFDGATNSAPFPSAIIVLEKTDQNRIVEWGLKV